MQFSEWYKELGRWFESEGDARLFWERHTTGIRLGSEPGAATGLGGHQQRWAYHQALCRQVSDALLTEDDPPVQTQVMSAFLDRIMEPLAKAGLNPAVTLIDVAHATLYAIPTLLQRHGIAIETDEIIAYITDALNRMPATKSDSLLNKEEETMLTLLLTDLS